MSDTPTPETDSLFYIHGYPVLVDWNKAMMLCERLEQERNELREQRDRLSDALRSIAALYESKEMTATVDQRIGDAYDMRCMARSALAAVKGGSDE